MKALLWLDRILLQRVLDGMAAILLFILMLVTCFDVAGRYFFNLPLPGAFEVTEVGLALLIYAALPALTVNEEHVTINLLDRVLPSGVRLVQRFLIKAICVGVLGLLTYSLSRRAATITAAHIRTDTLHISLGPVAYFMCAMAVLAMVGLFVVLVAEAFGYRRKGSPVQRSVE